MDDEVYYSDEEIARWERDDLLTDQERARLEALLLRSRVDSVSRPQEENSEPSE